MLLLEEIDLCILTQIDAPNILTKGGLYTQEMGNNSIEEEMPLRPSPRQLQIEAVKH